MKPVRQCPACEKVVELESVVLAGGVLAYRCCNCHHVGSSETFDEVSEATTGRSAKLPERI